MTDDRDRFGCDMCWPDSADQAWDAFRTLAVEKELVDESHFMVKIRCCSACSQRFVSVFTELIDWGGGEDPQSWTLLPISKTEARKLDTSAQITTNLNALAPDRRSLHREYPKGGEQRSFWATGILVGPHD